MSADPILPGPQDLDQSGFAFQGLLVYLGPSLGWVKTRVKPEFFITSANTYTLTSDCGVVLVNVAGNVIINLPDVGAWVRESAYNPSTAFERAIWIKDLGGNAAAFPITVNPFGSQAIDALVTPFSIIQNRQLLRLYPLGDLSGWFSG
jgi:hypothetical protein